jgi:tyrosinase
MASDPTPIDPVAVATVPPSAQPALKVRPSVESSDIPTLAAAYAKMQGRSEDENRSWVHWAEFHGYNRYDCWHHGNQGGQGYDYDLFLPWHRAYLRYFELEVFAEYPTMALPWWDWTSVLSHQAGIPQAYVVNPPLASGPVPASLRTNPPRTTRNPKPATQLPNLQTIEGILGLASFEDFSNQLQGQHDAVHGWTRGDMGTIVASAFDPVFWAHHCQIDRLWYLWQLRHGVNNIPLGYLDLVLAPWSLTVRDVLSVNALGYTYGVSRVLLPFPKFSPTVLAASGDQPGPS